MCEHGSIYVFCDRDCPLEWFPIEELCVPNIYPLEKKRELWGHNTRLLGGYFLFLFFCLF